LEKQPGIAGCLKTEQPANCSVKVPDGRSNLQWSVHVQ
jgi:hypothetical protein